MNKAEKAKIALAMATVAILDKIDSITMLESEAHYSHADISIPADWARRIVDAFGAQVGDNRLGLAKALSFENSKRSLEIICEIKAKAESITATREAGESQ